MNASSRIFCMSLLTFASYLLLFRDRTGTNIITKIRDHSLECLDHGYRMRVFSLDPLVVHLSEFISPSETQHLLNMANGAFAPSQRVDARTGKIGGVDTSFRKAETAFLPESDMTECIKRRAIDFQGHVSGARVESLQVVRYHPSDFVREHFDWFSESTVQRFNRFGRRDTSFFFYLHANCTGGGTNFPRLQHPQDPSWCDVIECGDQQDGVTFKAITGTGVFWQNWHLNDTPRYDVLHSGTPVRDGTKVGLNVWTSGPKVDPITVMDNQGE